MITTLQVKAPRRGLADITSRVQAAVREAGVGEGLCTLFVQHTSASLVVQENADPRVLDDLQDWIDRHAPEGDPRYTHNDEGPDDMPAHIRSAITATSLSVPVVGGRLALGTWQAVYLWEHLRRPRTRRVVVHVAP